MGVDDAAYHTAKALKSEYPEVLFAVGWYDGNRGEDTGIVYIADEFPGSLERGSNVLEEALFESISRKLYERLHDESLQCTARVYESLIDIDIPLNEYSGIVIAVDTTAGDEFTNILSLTNSVTTVELGYSPNNDS